MRYTVLLGLILMPLIANAQSTEPVAVKAWFTQAAIENSVQQPKPADALPEAPGTAGKGVLLTKPVAIENPLLKQDQGVISFWVKPNWNGNDGKKHVLLTIGDPKANGLIVEKSAENTLRYVMASPKKLTSSRFDVSGWKAGEWHHVAISWFSKNNKPLGMPLWIDHVAVDGPIAGGNEFLNPSTMKDKRVYVGDASSDATMDELIFRYKRDSEGSGEVGLVYRDYFRTAPYTAVRINPDALFVKSDKRVVNGCEKQFGLEAKYGGNFVPVTDYAVRYGQWADFDAKPFIKWTTSDSKVATVDKNGMVTGKSLGKCKLFAEYRGMKASYAITVISPDQPDLDLTHVELLPRYPWDEAKDRPDVGERVTSVAHIINFGYKPVPGGTVVRFELIPDSNRNFKVDGNEKPIEVQTQVIDKEMKPRDEQVVSFMWNYPATPTWIRVSVDPDDKVSEICEANNQRCELNNARPLRFAFRPKDREDFYDKKLINHIGSFSVYDWLDAQKDRFEKVIHDQVYPTTTPNGIQDSFRTDNFYEMKLGKWEDEPYVVNDRYYDGGFPVNEEIHRMAIDAAILHEFGHTCMALPDLYGYPVDASSVFLKDENGKPYAGGDLMPCVTGTTLPRTSANSTPCDIAYDSLMNSCHLWIDPSQAGQANYFAGFRGSRFWGTQGRYIPSREHFLKIYDINDEPLKGAAVYVYHVSQTFAEDAGTKYFTDRPKFIGNTDANGRFQFPEVTDKDWDDPQTDEVDGEIPVWNPFGRAKTTTGAPPDVAFTPNVWCVEGLLLVKIVSGDQTEFYWMSMTEFNKAFFEGETFRGVYPVKTSLLPSNGVTPIVRKPVPDAIKKVNLAPVAIAPSEMTVKCGEEFTIDGSKSYDPEGQPLTYIWNIQGTWLNANLSNTAYCKQKAPAEPKVIEYRFFVNDGVRVSQQIVIKVNVVK